MPTHTQHAIMARIVARDILFHPGPKDEALAEFTRQLWMLLQGKEEGYRQLHIQHNGAEGHGTGMAADVDKIIESALRMPATKMPETGGISIGYQLQLCGPEAAPPAQGAEGVGDDS